MKYIIAIITFLLAATASACSPVETADIFKTPQENFPRYDYVVSGTITKVVPNRNTGGNTYEFTIKGVHKGQIETNTIQLESAGHSCGFFSTVGTHLLLFTDDITKISELTPRQQFETAGEAYDLGYSFETSLQNEDNPFVCTKEYRPVCASYQVQCITTPCPPIDQTYANECLARAQNARVQYEGVCRDDNQQEPTSLPGEDFQGPTENPPYDNGPDSMRNQERGSWWYRVWLWLTSFITH